MTEKVTVADRGGLSTLSAEAQAFVPRETATNSNSAVEEVQQQCLNELPSYMTNCYPFVQGDATILNSSQNLQNPRIHFHRVNGIPNAGAQNMPPGGRPRYRNRIPVLPSQSPRFTPRTQLAPMIQPPTPFIQGTPSPHIVSSASFPVNAALAPIPVDGIPALSPTGAAAQWVAYAATPAEIYAAAFPGGYIAGGRERKNSSSSDGRSRSGGARSSRGGTSQRGINRKSCQSRNVQLSNGGVGNRAGKTSIGIQNEPITAVHGDQQVARPRGRTLIYVDIAIQTDFPDEIANLTLADYPNRGSSRDDKITTSATKYRRSKGETSTEEEEVDSDSGYSSPLHRRNQISNGTHAVPLDVLDSTRDAPVSVRSSYESAIFSMSVGESETSFEITTGVTPPSVAARRVSSEPPVAPTPLTYAQLVAKPPPKPAVHDMTNIPPDGVISGNNTDTGACDEVAPPGGDPNSGVTKKRRRRRGRRKKKGDDSEADTKTDAGEDGLKVAADPAVDRWGLNTVVAPTLHFEDEGEFPDLLASNETPSAGHGGATAAQNGGGHTHFSYSDMLKHTRSSPATPVAPTLANRARSLSGSQPGSETDRTAVQPAAMTTKESKAVRKMRKRREIANEAADKELLEISIEQQVLKEMSMKQQQTSTSNQQKPSPQSGGAGGASTSGGKKSKQPLSLNIADMISALEKQHEKQKHKVETPQKLYGEHRSQTHGDKGHHNILDSTAPAKRGKERELPKHKKPSTLKKVILKERERKKRLRLLEDPADTTSTVNTAFTGLTGADIDLSQDQDAVSSKASQSNDLSPISQNSPISMSPLSPGSSPLSSGVNSPIASLGMVDMSSSAAMKIHSRRFREYCNQVLDKDIDSGCVQFLQDLVRFQDRLYHKDPIKAKQKRRIVLGLREVTKHLKLRRIKAVIISPNLERIQSKGGLDEALNNIINMCQEQNVPFVFALGRRALGRACGKLVPVSVAGIFNYEGTEETFHKLMELTEKARTSYTEMVIAIEQEINENKNQMIGGTGGASSGAGTGSHHHLYAHMGHSRTPSACSAVSFTSSILSEPISEYGPIDVTRPIDKDVRRAQQQMCHSRNSSLGKMSITESICEIDEGNEADTEDLEMNAPLVPLTPGAASLSLGATSPPSLRSPHGDADGFVTRFDSNLDAFSSSSPALPHFDSIHNTSLELVSQHSGIDALSTHSSRTLGMTSPGSGTTTPIEIAATAAAAIDAAAAGENEPLLRRLKTLDAERIENWVESTASLQELNRHDVNSSLSLSCDDNKN
ncbi:uncharacterized protein LOC141914067 [Tubulanus polymorphus]|uniref:uncharacterized protein LOC141914067 n=1 Tax=Tubulanus polymorphus TaxID=672921 RepID=UPI003DA5956B